MNRHLTETELRQRLARAAREVSIGELYQHYKGGLYRVTDLAILESTNEVCVVYQAQYGERLSFIRPVSVWSEVVEYEGKNTARFTRSI